MTILRLRLNGAPSDVKKSPTTFATQDLPTAKLVSGRLGTFAHMSLSSLSKARRVEAQSVGGQSPEICRTTMFHRAMQSLRARLFKPLRHFGERRPSTWRVARSIRLSASVQGSKMKSSPQCWHPEQTFFLSGSRTLRLGQKMMSNHSIERMSDRLRRPANAHIKR